MFRERFLLDLFWRPTRSSPDCSWGMKMESGRYLIP